MKKNVSTAKIAPKSNRITNVLWIVSRIWTMLSAIDNWKTNEWPRMIQSRETIRIPLRNWKSLLVECPIENNRVRVKRAEYSRSGGIHAARLMNRMRNKTRPMVKIVPIDIERWSDAHRTEKKLKEKTFLDESRWRSTNFDWKSLSSHDWGKHKPTMSNGFWKMTISSSSLPVQCAAVQYFVE